MRLPVNATQEQLEAAYAKGLLRKEQLTHGAYYRGHCRNASEARWHAGKQCFVHWRTKFGHRFLETIRHPVDESRYDVFLAEAEVAQPEHPIPDERFEAA